MSDAYRTITVRLRSVTPTVIVADKAKTRGGGTCTIARSLLGYGSDKELDDYPRGPLDVEATIKVREWKADELGFA